MVGLILSKLLSIFEHECCFCDKEYDKVNEDGSRTIMMACNKCGQVKVITMDKWEESK
ncbi:hypothetical protein [Bacillus phage CM1]|nr:hypothetical protein [Bacillus phage CM1]